MGEIFSKIAKGALEVLKKIDWKPLVYRALKDHVIKPLREKAISTENVFWDNIAVDGLERVLDLFLAPKAVQLAALNAPPGLDVEAKVKAA